MRGLEDAIRARRAGVTPLLWTLWARWRQDAWLLAGDLIAARDRALLAAAIASPALALRDVARTFGDEETLRVLAEAEERATLARGVK